MDSKDLGDALRSSLSSVLRAVYAFLCAFLHFLVYVICKAVELHNVPEQTISPKDESNVSSSWCQGAPSSSTPGNSKEMPGTSRAPEAHFNSRIPQEQGHHRGGYNNHIGNWGRHSNYVDANNLNAIQVAMHNYNLQFLFPHRYDCSPTAYGQFPPCAPSGFSGGPWLPPHQMHSSLPYYHPVSCGPQQVTSARPPSQDYVGANNFNAIPWAMYNDYSPFLIPHGYGCSQMAYGQFPPLALSGFPIMSGGPQFSPHQMYSGLPYYGPVSYGTQHVTSARPPSQAELSSSGSSTREGTGVYHSGSSVLGLQSHSGSLDTSKPTSSQNVRTQPQGRCRSGGQIVPQGYKYQIKEPRASKQKGKSSASGDGGVESTSWYNTDCKFPNFKTDCERAKFFVIKSYNEENIHRSIRCNIWASTELGNSILDAAYREANQGKGICPVFLFFSVDTSGKFVGIAEMVGSVDFRNIDDGWMGYGWNGPFPVKWHIIKDVPSCLLKDIVLENNEGKPVTQSLNAQEVEMRHGIQMLKIFKNYDAEKSLLQYFPYYNQKELMNQLQDRLDITLSPKSDNRYELFY